MPGAIGAEVAVAGAMLPPPSRRAAEEKLQVVAVGAPRVVSSLRVCPLVSRTHHQKEIRPFETDAVVSGRYALARCLTHMRLRVGIAEAWLHGIICRVSLMSPLCLPFVSSRLPFLSL